MSSGSFAQEIRLARKRFEPARCGYSGQTSSGNNRDNDGGNNDVRRTNSTGGNKVWRNTGTENSNRRDNIRNSPDRTRTEVNLSMRTRRPCKRQTPNYGCNLQKFLHDSPADNLAGGSMGSFVGYSHAGTLG